MSSNPLSDAAEKKMHQHDAAREAAEEDGETIRTNVDIAGSTYRAFRRRCQREGRAMAKVLRRFMERYAAGDADPF